MGYAVGGGGGLEYWGGGGGGGSKEDSGCLGVRGLVFYGLGGVVPLKGPF